MKAVLLACQAKPLVGESALKPVLCHQTQVLFFSFFFDLLFVLHLPHSKIEWKGEQRAVALLLVVLAVLAVLARELRPCFLLCCVRSCHLHAGSAVVSCLLETNQQEQPGFTTSTCRHRSRPPTPPPPTNNHGGNIGLLNSQPSTKTNSSNSNESFRFEPCQISCLKPTSIGA